MQGTGLDKYQITSTCRSLYTHTKVMTIFIVLFLAESSGLAEIPNQIRKTPKNKNATASSKPRIK